MIKASLQLSPVRQVLFPSINYVNLFNIPKQPYEVNVIYYFLPNRKPKHKVKQGIKEKPEVRPALTLKFWFLSLTHGKVHGKNGRCCFYDVFYSQRLRFPFQIECKTNKIMYIRIFYMLWVLVM